MSNIETPEKLIAAGAVRAAFGGISDMTLYRWLDRKVLPEPTRINGRRYWPERVIRELQKNEKVSAWLKERAAEAAREAEEVAA
jgi:predicted DNA-binding transcriptional regulator AlpA